MTHIHSSYFKTFGHAATVGYIAIDDFQSAHSCDYDTVGSYHLRMRAISPFGNILPSFSDLAFHEYISIDPIHIITHPFTMIYASSI